MKTDGQVVFALRDLTTSEQALCNAYLMGEELDLSASSEAANDPNESNNWGEDRTIRAEVLAHLLLRPPEVVPHQPPRLRLKGAHVSGKLDVGCGNLTSFLFTSCRFDEIPLLNDATADFVGFASCYLPGFSAARIRCDGPLWLKGSVVRGQVIIEDAEIGGFSAEHVNVQSKNGLAICLCGAAIKNDLNLHCAIVDGELCFRRARIIGQVSLSGARLQRPDGYAWSAELATIGGTLSASNGFQCQGTINLEGIKVQGKVVFSEAVIKGFNQYALDLDHAEISLGLHANGMETDGLFRIHHARIGCQLNLSRVKLSNPGGDALRADHLIVDGSLLLNGRSTVRGRIDLHGAKIGCTLNLYELRLKVGPKDDSQAGLHASDLEVRGGILASGICIKGGCNFSGARIIGNISLNGANLTSSGRRAALDANRIQVGGGLNLGGQFKGNGGVSLVDASVGTTLKMNGCRLTNKGSKALDAAGISVKGDLIFNNAKVTGLVSVPAASVGGDVRFVDARLAGVPSNTASTGLPIDSRTGDRWRGRSLCVTGALIGGDLDLRGTYFRETLDLKMAQVARAVILDDTTLDSKELALSALGLAAERLTILTRARPVGAVDLASAKVDSLVDTPESWPEKSPIKLDGFKYRRIVSAMSLNDRLGWLGRATGKFPAEPYEQFVNSLIVDGREDEVRLVRLHVTRRAHQDRGSLVRAWGWLQDVLLGYGYLPRRAVIAFVFLWVSSSIWFTFGPPDCTVAGAAGPGLCPINPKAHPTWDPWLYSLDLLLPVVNLGQDTAWDPVGISKVIMYLLTIAGWALTATIVTAAGRTLKRS